jgi:hypothetical protein
MQMIAEAIRRGLSVADLKGLFDLQERFERNQAAQKFADALTAFQSKMPQVDKWKEGAKGAYKYAPYESIMEQAKPILVECGIVITFTTKQTERGIDCTCRVRVGTHSETTELFMPTPAGNNMINVSQNQGITLSYAKRNALKAALNIVERGEDVDGSMLGDCINKEQIAELLGLVEQIKQAGIAFDFVRFKQYLNVEKLEELPQRELPKAVAALRDKLKPKGGGK